MPSIPGMRISIRTTSGRRSAIADRPSVTPLHDAAVVTLVVEEPAESAGDRRVVINDQDVCHADQLLTGRTILARVPRGWRGVSSIASAMALDHGLGVDQAKADAFGLGRHERIEDPHHHPRIDADAIVVDLDDDFGAVGSGADGQRAAGWHRIDGVDEHVGQHLRKAFRIDHHLRQPIREGQRGLHLPVA